MQVTTDRFHQLARGEVVPLDWKASMSFTKKRRTDLQWFTLNQSRLNGADLLATQDNNPTQVWDAYEYADITDRVIDMGFERSVEFPYNVQSSVADITLNNYDGYLSYSNDNNAPSPVAKYMLPRRPLRLYMGFKSEDKLPVFVGMTQSMPSYSDDTLQVRWTAMDFLSEIAEAELRSAIKLRDVTTDKVIAVILQQYGMTPDQYKLAIGQNKIPFVIFNKGEKAGDALRKLVQAENGALWLDEQGIVRFTTRSGVVGKQPVMILNDSNIISIKPSRAGGIINHVKIKSEVRAVQKLQPIFSNENENGWKNSADEDKWRVPAKGRLEVWLSLSDPAWRADNLIFNGVKTSSWFTARNLSGIPVPINVTATGELFQDSYKVTFINTNTGALSIDAIELWGEPAKVVDTIDYEAYDSDSREKYGDMLLNISDNNFFGSYRNCDLLATDILSKQSEYSPNIEVNLKGDPSLQLGDIVEVDYKYPGTYLITAISMKMSSGLLETTIKARRQKIYSPFILDKSKLDSTDVLG